MADEVTICNQALGWLGANLIETFEGSSVEASLCKVNYPELRDTVLEEGRWTFAKEYVIPAEGQPVPREADWKYDFQFNLSEDWLLITRVFRDGQMQREVEWELANNQIHANCPKVYAEVIRRVVDVNRFTRTFRQALAYRIAAELAVPLTGDIALAQYYEQKYQLRLQDALAIDGMQGRNEKMRTGSMVTVRGAGRYVMGGVRNNG